MEAIRKQATKLREQVAKQQQSILKQFGGRSSDESFLVDEVEMQCYQKLQKLYTSTKAAKKLQRDVVHGVEAFIAISSRQMEIVKKMAENCCKYGNEHQDSSFPLSKASIGFGDSHKMMEKECNNLLGSFGDQAYEPLQTMLTSAPLEDARLLTYRYRRIRQDVEAQTEEVVKRQLRSKESGPATEVATKLQNAEIKLSELRTTLLALGREATASMMAVEAKQQHTTFQCLLAMVDAERAYHQNVTNILDKLHDEMIQIKEHHEHAIQTKKIETEQSLTANKISNSSQSEGVLTNGQDQFYFVGEVIHPFDAQADGELSLSVGDYVVVRQVAPNGWSEGECKGKAGWFPSAYVEQRDKAPASRVIETPLLT